MTPFLTPFLLSTKAGQLFVGVSLLIAGVAVMPFLAGLIVWAVTKSNAAAFGPLHGWGETFLAFLKMFFASFCVVLAGYGAVLLAITTTIGSGLIKNPWE